MSNELYSNKWGISLVLELIVKLILYFMNRKLKYSWLIYLAFDVWLYIEIKSSWQEIIVYIYLLMSLVWNLKNIYTYYTKYTAPKLVHFSLNNF